MEKRIEKERRGKSVEEVTRLNLDNCQSTEIIGLTDEYKNLTSLSLINAGLTSLKGFPNLPKLRKLDLSDNKISDDLYRLEGCPSLSYLNLSGNHIKTVEALQPLKSLRELHHIDLFNCELANTDGYREKIFELLDGLLYIDGFDKNDEEADIDDGEDDDEDDDESDGGGPNGDHVVDLDDEDDDDEDDEVGLEYLQKPGLEDESDGEEFAPREGEHEDYDDEDDSEEEASRGVKRKRDGDDDEEGEKGE